MRKKSPPVLELDRACIQRDGTRILNDVSWRVERGQHWVMIGANGSGKTSLLAALTGYLMPTSGDIDLLGRRYGESDWRALRTRIGLVSSSLRQMMADTETALESVASGKYAMIDFWGRVRGEDRRRARDILRRIECPHLADRPWLVLSQGERQRVLIGRALMARPRVLILDEPCAGLDPAAREHFLDFLQRLGRSRAAPTLILVTHHVEEIMPVFSHVLVLKDGNVMASGRRRAILRSEILSAAFDAPARLTTAKGRYQLAVRPNRHVVL